MSLEICVDQKVAERLCEELARALERVSPDRAVMTAPPLGGGADTSG